MGSASSRALETARVASLSASRSMPPARSTLTRRMAPFCSTSKSSRPSRATIGSTSSCTRSAGPNSHLLSSSRALAKKNVGGCPRSPASRPGVHYTSWLRSGPSTGLRSAGTRHRCRWSVGLGDVGDEVGFGAGVGELAAGPLQAADGHPALGQLLLALGAHHVPRHAGEALLGRLPRLLERAHVDG